MAKAVKKAKARPLRSRPRHTFILKRHECEDALSTLRSWLSEQEKGEPKP